MKKLKKVLYWITVVPVITDCVVGCIKGIIKGVNDVKKQAQLEWESEQNAKFVASFKSPVSDVNVIKK